MDYFFSKTAYPSLALNIVRYNIGGAPNSTWDGINVGDPNFDSFKGISSFWLPNGQWNWDADMGQRRILAGAIQAGVNIIEAFANSRKSIDMPSFSCFSFNIFFICKSPLYSSILDD